MSAVILVTGATEDVAQLETISFASKRSYCERWGYGIARFQGWEAWKARVGHHSHLGFARIAMLKDTLELELLKSPAERAQFVFWMDADAAVTNPDIALGVLLNTLGQQSHVFATFDFNGFHSGTMAFRVSRQSLDILNAVWYCDPKYETGHWFEQGALHDVLVARDAYRMGEVYILDKRILNGYPDIDRYRKEHSSLVDWVCETYLWKPWSFVVHIPNYGADRKIEIMIDCLTTASEWQNRRQTILPGEEA